MRDRRKASAHALAGRGVGYSPAIQHRRLAMPKLFDKQTNQPLGSITPGELQFLLDQFEEESSTDQDYYIDLDTVEMLAEAGASESLLEVLRGALAGRADAEIRWEAD